MARLRIALVAGEASGDILGSGLMRALKARHSDIEFIGVGGPLMEAEGMRSSFPMERLSVMGLVEVLGRLRELLKRRKQLVKSLIEHQRGEKLLSTTYFGWPAWLPTPMARSMSVTTRTGWSTA